MLMKSFALIKIVQTCCLAWPGLPFLRLWKDTIDDLNFDNDLTRILWDQEAKLALDTSAQREHKKHQAKYLIYLNVDENISTPTLTKQNGIDKIQILIKSLYRPEFLAVIDPQKNHMKQIVNIINNIDIYTLNRPSTHDTKHECLELIKTTLTP